MELSNGRSTGAPDASQLSGWPVDLLQSIWSEQRELLGERIQVLERAAAALEGNQLTEPLRVEACRAAHMLAGVVAIFGFQAAGETARELELELASPEPERAPRVRELVSRLRLIASDASHVGLR